MGKITIPTPIKGKLSKKAVNKAYKRAFWNLKTEKPIQRIKKQITIKIN